jgi:fluoride ion exporter CrcB/FEX
MDQVIQLLGALLILVAFAAAQRGSLRPTSRAYLALNLVGSLILGILALHAHQWGFVLLETAWAVVSAWGLLQALIPTR